MIDKRIANSECCGCKMCSQICPVGAIDFREDKNGFWNPVVDEKKCIKCGLCIDRCPVITQEHNRKLNVTCYGAWNKKDSVRMDSTSGGVFYELAMFVLRRGGVCYGAAYNNAMRVEHIMISKESDLIKIMKSKYVQSDTSGVYISVKEQLTQGKVVLFSGTPCQVHALYNFLGNVKIDNLITVDFICCGVPSPLAFKKYIEMLETQYHSKISHIWFKNKRLGWHNLGTYIQFANGGEYFRTGNRDKYMTAYIKDGLTIRNSCTSCRFRNVPHCSDITLGDFWGIETLHPEYNDERGVSAVMINSSVGEKVFQSIIDSLDCFDTQVDDIAYGNFTLFESKAKNQNQDAFFSLLKDKGFRQAIRKYGSYTGFRKVCIDVKYYIKRLLVHIGGNYE